MFVLTVLLRTYFMAWTTYLESRRCNENDIDNDNDNDNE
jgi:hypothetical protein